MDVTENVKLSPSPHVETITQSSTSPSYIPADAEGDEGSEDEAVVEEEAMGKI